MTFSYPELFLSSKHKAAIAEAAITFDLLRRGYQVYRPVAEMGDTDLILERVTYRISNDLARQAKRAGDDPREAVAEGMGPLERVQVKYVRSDGEVLTVRGRVHSVSAGQVSSTKVYTKEDIHWLAVYDASDAQCYYVAADEFTDSGMINLRLRPAKNGQLKGVRWAMEYQQI